MLIRGIDRLDTYRGEAALLTWLCSLCRREIANWWEREGRSREVAFSDEHADTRAALELVAALQGDDPDLALQRRELSHIVQLALDHLPGRYGDVLEWKYLQELSVAEIAERLGVGYKAAESILSRARVAFRDGFSIVAGGWPDGPHGRRPQSSEGS